MLPSFDRGALLAPSHPPITNTTKQFEPKALYFCLNIFDCVWWSSAQLDTLERKWFAYQVLLVQWIHLDLELDQRVQLNCTLSQESPSPGDIVWRWFSQWSTGQPAESSAGHQSRAHWGQGRQTHGSHKPGNHKMVLIVSINDCGAHLLKGQQLALVDLLESISNGGVELRLRAFLPLEHWHGWSLSGHRSAITADV